MLLSLTFQRISREMLVIAQFTVSSCYGRHRMVPIKSKLHRENVEEHLVRVHEWSGNVPAYRTTRLDEFLKQNLVNLI